MMQSQAHTGLYYAATVNDVTDYAQLRGEQTADVCVIGAGFTGISTHSEPNEFGLLVVNVYAEFDGVDDYFQAVAGTSGSGSMPSVLAS